MKTLSLKLDQDIFEETEEIIEKRDMPRNRYINEALKFYNAVQRRKFLSEQFAYEVPLVTEQSMQILREFDEMEEDDQAI
jgi:metal-responsive CopG/Arc/MetJ family transcriptional regulator